MVDCPICGKDIAMSLINQHLDECEKTRDQPAPKPAPKPPAKSLASVLTGGRKRKSTYKYERDHDVDQPREKIQRAEASSQVLGSSQQLSSSPSSSAGATTAQDAIRLLKMESRLPLAERLRPKDLDDYVGQRHLVGQGGILYGFIKNDRIPSMILWGYPGTGKTTLARIISHRTKSRFVELSATSNGISDCKRVFEEARHEKKLTGRDTIVFVDEIHRFNKTQQDIFLPHVERGTITLIGATTENPSFQLNSALLSRCRVFVLKKLSADELKEIIGRALVVINKTRKLVNGQPVLKFATDTIEYLANISDGDSRSALNLLELADSHYQTDEAIHDSQGALRKMVEVGEEDLRMVLKRTQMVYDRVGDAHYDSISAFHKSVRGGNPDAAMYYLARMLKGGEDPLYIARRMIRIASEDIGVMDDSCLPFAISAYRAVQLVGLPEADLALAHCAVKLARAPKSIEVYRAWGELNRKIDNEPQVGAAPIPLHLRNAPTKLMDDLGYSKGYKYNPDYKDGKVKQTYFPEEVGELKLLRGKHLGEKIDTDL